MNLNMIKKNTNNCDFENDNYDYTKNVEIKNKEVNWHQVLIYKENELTPRQRYMQRKEEEK